MTCIRLVLAASMLTGCAGKAPPLALGMEPRPGWACGAVSVGVASENPEFLSEPIACKAELVFELLPGGQTAIAMPPPSDRSAAVERAVRSSGVSGRRLEIADPRPRADAWRLTVANESVDVAAAASADARMWRWRDHWFVVFVVSAVARGGDTVFPLPVRPEARALSLWRQDPAYCVGDLTTGLALYEAAEGAVARSSWPKESRLAPLAVYCSDTHKHVFAVDLGPTEVDAVDVGWDLANHERREFRLQRRMNDNYTVVDVILRPVEF